MRLTIVFMITILVASCKNPVNEDKSNKYQLTNTFKNHLAEDNLSGPVSALTIYSCNEKFDSCCLTMHVTYNSKGNRIKQILYYCPDPTLITVGELYWYEYYYDSLGRLKNRVRMEGDNRKVYEWINEYNTTDLASRCYYVDHWTIGDTTIQLFSYDSIGRYTGYEGHLIENSGISERVSSSLIIVFNEIENSITYEWKNGNNTIRTIKNIYDEQGLMVEFIDKNFDGTILANEKYEYILFDDNGNWTKRMVIGSNGNKKTEKREIEYY